MGRQCMSVSSCFTGVAVYVVRKRPHMHAYVGFDLPRDQQALSSPNPIRFGSDLSARNETPQMIYNLGVFFWTAKSYMR